MPCLQGYLPVFLHFPKAIGVKGYLIRTGQFCLSLPVLRPVFIKRNSIRCFVMFKFSRCRGIFELVPYFLKSDLFT